jgi:D-tyrosyl-tRNA(Tyr) deacylase
MNRSVRDVAGGLLVVSQFTLFASTRKGTRPSFNDAARPEAAIPLYETFLQHAAAALGRPVAAGRFGAMMQVTLVNDGPVTLIVDSRDRE